MREDRIDSAIDAWLARLFDPAHLEDTCRLLAQVDSAPEIAARLEAARPTTTWTPDQVQVLVEELGDVARVLADADKKQKAQLYDELGLELVFDSERNLVSVGVSVPCTRSVSEGGLEPPRPFGH